MIGVLWNGQARKHIQGNDIAVDRTEEQSPLPVIKNHDGNIRFNYIFVKSHLHAFLNRPNLDISPWSNVNLQVFRGIFYAGVIVVVSNFWIIRDYIFKKFDLFSVNHCDIGLVFVKEVDWRILWEVFINYQVLDKLIVLTVPNLHNWSRIQRYDDVVLMRATDVY